MSMHAWLRSSVPICTLMLLAVGLLVSACQTPDPPAVQSTAPSAAQGPSDTPTIAERGQEFYRANCAVCHGEHGERGAAPLKGAAQRLDDAAIAVIIVEGLPAKGMPALATLADEQVEAVVAFIRSWDQP